MEKSKKLFKYILSFILFSSSSFGAGIFVAEIKLNYFDQRAPVRIEIENKHTLGEEDKNQNQPENFSSELQFRSPEDIEAEIKAREAEEAKNRLAKIENEIPAQDQKEKANEKEKILFKFAVIGDTQRKEADDPSGPFQRAVANLKKHDPSLVFALGDLVSSCDGKNGCEEKLNNWKKIMGTLFGKTYAAMGNHDRTGGEKADKLWQKFFSFPSNGPSGYSELVYSFDYQNSHFVVLNSEKPEEHIINETQRDWLEKNLAASSKKNIFVFFHQPAFPVSSKIGESLDASPKNRNDLWEILVKHKVKAVFCGHEHIASRRKVQGLYQFVFGNTDSFHHDMPKAGMAEYAHRGRTFGLIEVGEKQITVKTYSVEGNLLNSFTF